MNTTLFNSTLHSLPLLQRGKVRDIYSLDAAHLLIVTTDRLSAFDVVLPTPIPGKGEVLTRLANFWFTRTRHIVPNHLTGIDPAGVVSADERGQVVGRSTVVKLYKTLPVEAIVRGYLIGSGWKDYLRDGTVCGINLPAGLREAERLPQPLFTPSTKAEQGLHDANISYSEMERLLGASLAQQVREVSLALYQEAAAYALTRGIIIADTKFEFGMDEHGKLVLIDEALTPDSSRFWPVQDYRPGTSPPSFDKQYVRDYLESLNWDKRPPGPELPPDVVARTTEKYCQALYQLTGEK